MRKILSQADGWSRHELMDTAKWALCRYQEDGDPEMLVLFESLYDKILSRYGEKAWVLYRRMFPRNEGLKRPSHMQMS